jgi:uncharacterized protein YndB with AHSA1/START domain
MATQIDVSTPTALAGETITHVYSIYIQAGADRIWQALTDGDQTVRYFFGGRVENYTVPGGNYQFTGADGKVMVHGAVLEVEPPRKLVTTFVSAWMEEGFETTVTYQIDPVGDACKLTLVHAGLMPGAKLTEEIQNGWAVILSSLKSMLETGEPLHLPDM